MNQYPFVFLALISFTNAQSSSCLPITVNDIGSTTEFSSDGLVAQSIVLLGTRQLADTQIPVRIRNFTVVCDASGDRRNTSSFVSVVVEFECIFSSSDASWSSCDGSTIVIRQYQFQCIEQNGQVVWDAIVSGSTTHVQTLNPTATLSTPLDNQCRRCIDDQHSIRADTTNHIHTHTHTHTHTYTHIHTHTHTHIHTHSSYMTLINWGARDAWSSAP